MKRTIYSILVIVLIVVTSCSSDDNDSQDQPEVTFQLNYDGLIYDLDSVVVTSSGFNQETGFYNANYTFLATMNEQDLQFEISLFSSEELSNDGLSSGTFVFDDSVQVDLFYNEANMVITVNSEFLLADSFQAGTINFTQNSEGIAFVLDLISAIDGALLIGEYEGSVQ